MLRQDAASAQQQQPRRRSSDVHPEQASPSREGGGAQTRAGWSGGGNGGDGDACVIDFGGKDLARLDEVTGPDATNVDDFAEGEEEDDDDADLPPGKCPRNCCRRSGVGGRLRVLLYHHVSDWVLGIVVVMLGWAIQLIAKGPLFTRVFYEKHVVLTGSGTNVTLLDPSLNFPTMESIFSTPVLGVTSLIMPCVYALVFNIVRFCTSTTRRWFTAAAAADDVHYFILMMVFSSAFNNVFTSGLKVTAGRYRPDYYARLASGDSAEIEEGGLSYPSGHASTAMAGLVPMALHILSMSGALSGGGPPGVFWKLFLASLPMVLAVSVAVSRTMDYHHNFADINAGMAIGIISAVVAYVVVVVALPPRFHACYPPLTDGRDVGNGVGSPRVPAELRQPPAGSGCIGGTRARQLPRSDSYRSDEGGDGAGDGTATAGSATLTGESTVAT